VVFVTTVFSLAGWSGRGSVAGGLLTDYRVGAMRPNAIVRPFETLHSHPVHHLVFLERLLASLYFTVGRFGGNGVAIPFSTIADMVLIGDSIGT